MPNINKRFFISKKKTLNSIFFLSHFQRKWCSEFLHKWPPNLTYFRWSRGPKSIRPLWTVLPALVSRGHFSEMTEGVRFLRAELQTALTSRLLDHIRVDFTHETMMTNILQSLLRFWKSTWIFAWYVDTIRITHPAYQKMQNCVVDPKIAMIPSNSHGKQEKTHFENSKSWSYINTGHHLF
mgnify:CR=1 FL=1